MKNFLRDIKGNIWLKISGFNSFSVLSRVVSSWIINKIIALYIGPEGTSFTEQFKNFIQGLQGFAVLGIQEGVTKFTAQYQEDKKQFSNFARFSFKMVLGASVLLGLFIALYSNKINDYLFPDADFSRLIFWSGIFLPLLALNLIILAILKGLQDYKTIVNLNVFTNFVSILLAFWLITRYHITGALALILLTQLIQFILSLYLLFRKFGFSKFLITKDGNYNFLKKLTPYIIMALVSALIIPLFSILIRNHIFHFFGDEGPVRAGYWDATRKTTNLFLSIISPVFAMYYYPQMAKVEDSEGLKKEIKKFFSQMFPLFTMGMILLYLFRRPLIKILFTTDYLPMESLFLWQLLGDYLKILSFLLAYLMLAKAHLVRYLFSELGFWIIYYLLTLVLMKQFALKGVVIAYFISYTLYILFLVINYQKYFKEKNIPIK